MWGDEEARGSDGMIKREHKRKKKVLNLYNKCMYGMRRPRMVFPTPLKCFLSSVMYVRMDLPSYLLLRKAA